MSAALVRLHLRFGSPWVATLTVGTRVGSVSPFSGLRTLVLLSAANGIVNYSLLNTRWICRTAARTDRAVRAATARRCFR